MKNSEIADANGPTSDAAHRSGNSGFEDFVYILSHDVRASVRALVEVPEWIADDLRDQGQDVSGTLAENLKFLSQHSARLDKIMVDLLSYSRVGRMQVVQSINLARAVNNVLAEQRIPKGFDVSLDLADHRLQIGENDIMLLLSALISNAIKHHDSNRGTLWITAEFVAGDYVLRVQDDGPGIPDSEQARVFDVMSTLKPRDEVEGSGMGLPIVEKIVAHYKGSLFLSDGLNGRGLTVEIRLPG